MEAMSTGEGRGGEGTEGGGSKSVRTAGTAVYCLLQPIAVGRERSWNIDSAAVSASLILLCFCVLRSQVFREIFDAVSRYNYCVLVMVGGVHIYISTSLPTRSLVGDDRS